jgi:type II secretory pathway pseudopilin PulG
MSVARTMVQGRRPSSRGYTAIEVMLAMTVLIISSAGVMSMQKAAIQGNLDARKLDVANAISRTWLDRLSTDASAWNSAVNLNNTVLLNTLVSGSMAGTATTTAAFQMIPTGLPTGWSGAFDLLGRDVSPTDPSVVFCTFVAIDTMATSQDAGAGASGLPTFLRATVLVFWPTQLAQGGTPGPGGVPFCSTLINVSTVNSANLTYHTLFATESLRRAP